MSGTRESGLWRWLAKARPVLRDDLHMTRVENSVASGTPDVEGQWAQFGQFWIELKSEARPARDSSKVPFRVRDGQVEWLRRRCAAGGQAWLMLQVGSGRSAGRYLVWGALAHQVRAGVTEDWLRALCALRAYRYRELDPGNPVHFVRRACAYYKNV